MNEEHSPMVLVPELPVAWEPFQSQEKTATAIKADLAKRVTPLITSEQMDLIRSTVAKNATPDELKLYLFDCQRQGVHPLDKLIHFTVRINAKGQRRYTPITSIDFMRIRAAETGEYAGSDDAIFGDEDGPVDHPHPVKATVTVWRLVQGQRCPFTASARWAEYKPEKDDWMWRKMGFGQLGKCAEALALRKGFPRQLAGLYAKEEMDQAERHGPTQTSVPRVPPLRSQAPERLASVELNTADSAVRKSTLLEGPAFEPPNPQNDQASEYVMELQEGHGQARGEITLQSGEVLRYYDAALTSILEAAHMHHLRINLTRKTSAAGKTYLVKAELLEQPKEPEGAF